MPRPTVWILEDQLSHGLPALGDHPDAPVLLIESDRHYRSLPYHKHRIAFQVSALRHFADEMKSTGRTVDHYPFVPARYRDSLAALRHHIRTHRPSELIVTDPADHHTRAWIDTLSPSLGVPIRFLPNTMFLTSREDFAAWARPLKSPVMEFFYRRQRTRFDVLMEKGQPIGGQWNLDKQNRKPPAKGLTPPPLPAYTPDPITLDVLQEVARRFPDHPGSTDNFTLPVTRTDALAFLADFIAHRLPLFGDYEDAMLTGQPFLYHSFISPQLNAGLLEPLECIRAAEAAYRSGHAPLNAVEGFIRQILGWREYVYGIYHTFMPEYRTRNARNTTRPLPDLFWTADTDLNCLHQTVSSLIKHSYTHHIQRLMILCNFATLAGLSPQAMNDWFLAMYADSHDWVVTPNVIGMGMNADGGTMATKPYVSSGAYINRMSDYCKGCKYDITTRDQPDSCPFNYLYWTFLHHYHATLARNPRMTLILKGLDRIDPGEMATMTGLRTSFLESLAQSSDR